MSALFDPQNPDKKTILSIDGGGLRGVISLEILAEMERRTNQPAYDLFDMFTGTSTGAIIAAGLALGQSASQILEIYRTALPAAFGKGGLLRFFKFLLTGLRYLYPLEPFYELLSPFAKGVDVKDITDKIILLTVKDVRTGNTYYVVNKGPGASAFADWPLIGVVASSAAAPIYFPPVLGNFIDGGVGIYGNPCFSTAVEAMEYIGADEGFVDDNVILISLGTGYPPETNRDGAAGRFSVLEWIPYVVAEGLNDSAFQQVSITRKLYGQRIDFRRYNPYLTRGNLKTLNVADNGRDPAKLALDSSDPRDIALLSAIGKAYAQQLDFSQANVMPWMTTGGHPVPAQNVAADWSKLPVR